LPAEGAFAHNSAMQIIKAALQIGSMCGVRL